MPLRQVSLRCAIRCTVAPECIKAATKLIAIAAGVASANTAHRPIRAPSVKGGGAPAPALVHERIEAIGRQSGEAIEGALDPAEGVLAQREVMLGLDREAVIAHELLERAQRELIKVSRCVEMEPSGPTPARLQAREVRHRDDQPSTGLEDAMALLDGVHRICDVLEHVPDDHLIERGRLEACVPEASGDPDVRTRIGALGRGLAHLDTEDFEAAIGERAEKHAAPATHVEHAGPLRQAGYEEIDVSPRDRAHEELDESTELGCIASVIGVWIGGLDLARVEHGMVAAESTNRADHDRLWDALDLERGDDTRCVADRTTLRGLDHGPLDARANER